MSVVTPAPDLEAGAHVVRIPPPLYFGAAFAAGTALRSTGTSLRFGTGAATLTLGAAVVAAGAALAVAGVAQVTRAGTTIVPHRPVVALLTSGVYRLSRNPMYTGLAIAYLGATLLAGSWWPLLTWPLALLATRILVIGPEERYLTDRFGQAYRDYHSRTEQTGQGRRTRPAARSVSGTAMSFAHRENYRTITLWLPRGWAAEPGGVAHGRAARRPRVR